MASTARLERLAKIIHSDINALPDREGAHQSELMEKDDESGGVPLEPSVIKEAGYGHHTREEAVPSASSSKQPANESSTNTLPAATQAQTNTDRRFVLVKGAVSAYNPGVMRSSLNPPKPTSQLPAVDLNRGDLAAAHHHFTPIQALAKYPYKYCDRALSQDIASAFFDEGKFWKREWDLYYVWDVEPLHPLILVPETQFQGLLEEINSHLKLKLRITNPQREEGLSREQYNDMVQNTPSTDERPSGPPDSGTLEQFKQMMEELWDAQKNKNKAKKAKQQLERLAKQASMVDQLKRAQRYLGLRATEATDGVSHAIDPMFATSFAFDQSVVFVCVDVESHERAHHKITEVGLATLDTRDLVGVAPGKDGEEWRKKIKARHFRINEHRHLINHDFVQGHPEGFNFGQSTFVDLQEAPTHVAACFHPPFGVHTSNTPEDEFNAIMLRELDLNEKRSLVFLGHDTLGDIRYLQQLGYDPLKVVIEAMDTAKIYQAWRRDPQPTSLGRIMNDFDVAAWKLHNAGNDAVYTVQAMLAICVREATIRGSTELDAMRNEDKTARIAAAQEAAVQRAKEEAEGWSDNEAVGDGGAPVLLKTL